MTMRVDCFGWRSWIAKFRGCFEETQPIYGKNLCGERFSAPVTWWYRDNFIFCFWWIHKQTRLFIHAKIIGRATGRPTVSRMSLYYLSSYVTSFIIESSSIWHRNPNVPSNILIRITLSYSRLRELCTAINVIFALPVPPGRQRPALWRACIPGCSFLLSRSLCRSLRQLPAGSLSILPFLFLLFI